MPHMDLFKTLTTLPPFAKTGLNSIEGGDGLELEEDAAGVFLSADSRSRDLLGTTNDVTNKGPKKKKEKDDDSESESEVESDDMEGQLEAQYDEYLDRKGLCVPWCLSMLFVDRGSVTGNRSLSARHLYHSTAAFVN